MVSARRYCKEYSRLLIFHEYFTPNFTTYAPQPLTATAGFIFYCSYLVTFPAFYEKIIDKIINDSYALVVVSRYTTKSRKEI